MSKCNGKCSSCSDKKVKPPEVHDRASFPFNRRIDVSSYLEPPPKQEQDNTPLDYQCRCDWHNGKTKRYMCLPCIKTFVEAVSYEEAIEEANRLENKGKRVAADRIRETAEYRKWKGKIKC